MLDITENKFKIPFFWTLVVLYFFTASLLIFYALGYTFNTTRGIFVYAGSMTIKSNPQDVDVEMNGGNVSKKLNRLNNSFHIDRIQPDDYIVKISSPGFNTWTKKITVHSGLSTEFWNVLLTRTSYERTAYPSDNTFDFFISPNKNLLAAAKKDGNRFSVSIIDTDRNETRELFSSEEYSFTDNKDENIEWSPQSQSIILPLIKEGRREYLAIDVESGISSSISGLSGLPEISNVRWDTKNKNILYFVASKNLYKMDLGDPQNKKILAKSISSYDISGGLLYYVQLPSGIVFKVESDGNLDPKQITTSAPSDMEKHEYKIIVYDEQKLVIRSDDGQLYIFNIGKKDEYFKKLADNVKGSQFSNDGKKLLFWDNREIYVYYLADWETQPRRGENEIKSVTRYSQQLSNVQWNNDFEHVIFMVGKEIKVAELDDRDNMNIFNITSLSTNSSRVVENFSENKLYFIDKEEGMDKTIIYSIEFPEKTGLLNF